VSEDNIDELPVEHAELHAKERICKDCGKSFSTIPELATHSRYCEPAKERHDREKGEQEQHQYNIPSRKRQPRRTGTVMVSPMRSCAISSLLFPA
jgi:hypothetical protein